MNGKQEMQVLLFVVFEGQSNESKPVKLSTQDKIKGYVLYLSSVLKQQSKVCELFFKNGVQILSERECPALQVAFKNGQVEIMELIIASNGIQVFVETGNCELASRILGKNVFICKTDFNAANIHHTFDEGSADIFKRLLSKKANYTYRNPRGGTLLHLAAGRSNVGLIKTLLNIGTNVDAGRKDGSTALHLAVQKRNVEIANLLLKSGACINARKENGSTCLLMAAERGCFNIVKLLLENGASVEIGECDGLMPIHAAARIGSVEIVAELLMHGANANAMITHGSMIGSTPLWLAVNKGSSVVVRLLLERKADVNTQYSGATVFYLAAKKGFLKIAQLILKYQPDPNIESNKQVLRHIVLSKKENSNEITKLMLEQGFSVNSEDLTDSKFFENAIRQNHFEVVAHILRGGADMAARFSYFDYDFGRRNRVTPLHLAVKYADVAMVELLLRYEAGVNAIDSMNLSPIHTAIAIRQTDIVKLLLENNADTGRYFEYLCFSAKTSSLEIVEAFLAKGAVPDDENSQPNDLPLTAAASRGEVKMVQLLLKYGAKINGRNQYGETALHVASHSGHLNIVRILISHNADVEAKCTRGKTPVLRAVEGAHIQVVNFLLRFGANIDFSDQTGQSVLHYAAQGPEKIFEALLTYNFTNINLIKLDLCQHLVKNYKYIFFGLSSYLNRNCTSNCTNLYFQVIKMSEANICSNEEQFFPTDEDRSLGGYKALKSRMQPQLKEEIESMKAEKIGDSSITFYNLLTADENKLAGLMRQSVIRQGFCSEDYKSKYPNYTRELECQFEKGVRRKKLLERSIEAAYISLKLFSEFPYEVMEKIFDYLRNKDIEWLLDPKTRLEIAELNCRRSE